MPSESAFERIQDELQNAATALVEEGDYGIAGFVWGDAFEPPEDTSVFAVLGFSGDAVKGAIVIGAERAVAAKLVPEGFCDGEPTDDIVCDQMGEIANQLLGRLKNRLLAGGVVLSLATPTTAIGRRVRFTLGAEASSRTHVIAWDDGQVFVRFDAVFAPEFELGDLDSAPEAAMTEGDMMLF